MNTGEPAFPNEGFNGWGEPFKGMTLRDYFAAKAMEALLKHYDIPEVFRLNELADPKGMASLLAKDAYTLADKMLKAREQ